MPDEQSNGVRVSESSWFWTLLLGLSMVGGGCLALIIASTRVVLPYDEALAGLSRAQLEAVNDHLLLFMAHDRVSLAGSMIAVGLLYTLLSLFGVRRGMRWARTTILISAFTGFSSFFLFLGFGYFDPFHAFVTAILFPLLLLALHGRVHTSEPCSAASPFDAQIGRWDWWGRWLLIGQGAVLLAAGVVISFVGITSVFVPEDLEFMHASAEELARKIPQLLPLIAHDRASFGGMLLSVGWVMMLSPWWGWRKGSAWLWWAILLAGTAGYVPAIAVHLVVGYTNTMHLAPAFAGAGFLLLGLLLSRSFLCSSNE
jgi:dihydroorotate dehydrogenase